ncbi:host cell factor 2-like, partial [Watersipora subatra]|uniref:host cell factor 2-like n=1 Tax=Watersipora subatra TaxID=2589382 RepID=UPI00355BB3D8
IDNILLAQAWLDRSRRTDVTIADVLKGVFAVCSKHFNSDQLKVGHANLTDVISGEIPQWSAEETNSKVKQERKPSVRWNKIQSYTGPPPKPRHGHRAVTVKDLIIIFGGGNAGLFDQLHVFNTVTLQWFIPAVKGDLPPSMAAHGMVTDGGTKVIICSGMHEYGRYGNDVYQLQASRWEWKKMKVKPPANDDPPLPRIGHSFTYHKRMIYLFGGLANETEDPKNNVVRYLDDFYILLFLGGSTAKWVKPETVGNPPSPRESHTANIYTNSNNKAFLVIYGGMDGTRLGDLHMLNISDEQLQWVKPVVTGCVPSPRSLHTAEVIGDRLYIFGGWTPLVTDEGEQWKVTNTIACYNLGHDAWEEVSLGMNDDCCPQPRAGHCAASVYSRIYIWSGRDGYKQINNDQVCFKDLWCLETAKPQAPSVIQLVEAQNYSLEVCWEVVPTAEAYLLQIKRYDLPTLDNSKSDYKVVKLMANKTSSTQAKSGPADPIKPKLTLSAAPAICETVSSETIANNKRAVKVIEQTVKPVELGSQPKKAKIISIVKSVQGGVSFTRVNQDQLSKTLPPGAKLVKLPTDQLSKTLPSGAKLVKLPTWEKLRPTTLPGITALAPNSFSRAKNDAAFEADKSNSTSEKDKSPGADKSSDGADPTISKGKQSAKDQCVTQWPWYDVAVMNGTSAIISHYHIPDNDKSEDKPSVMKLAAGQSYKVRVASLNACGRSKWSPISAFRTCEPGYPSVPTNVKILKNGMTAHVAWEPPLSPNDTILEYSLYIAVKSSVSSVRSSLPKLNHRLAFSRIYVGCPTMCVVSASTLAEAHIENNSSDGGKPSLIFRLAAKNKRGYGAAVQVRWLQDFQGTDGTTKPQATLTLETTQRSAITPATTLQLTPAVLDKAGRLILKGNTVTTSTEPTTKGEPSPKVK